MSCCEFDITRFARRIKAKIRHKSWRAGNGRFFRPPTFRTGLKPCRRRLACQFAPLKARRAKHQAVTFKLPSLPTAEVVLELLLGDVEAVVTADVEAAALVALAA